MKASEYLLATLKEVPADAEIISHQLMLRAGMIRKIAAGVYSWLPLGLKVLNKVANIVREEMNRAGGLEVLLPSIQPAELWQESGRWEAYGKELLRFHDRHERDFCYGPTHEEIITTVMRTELKSYKQLPLNVYQIQTKFRDEIRPRFGVMRAREFIMKDAYSFDVDQTSHEKSYAIMLQAYKNIFTRLGLDFRAVLADSGSIGGDTSHEFQVLAQSGEDIIAVSDASDYAANIELAQALAPQQPRPAASKAIEKVATPQQQTIEAVSQFLKVKAEQTIKTLLVKGNKTEVVALVLRGDHELNPLKAEKFPQVASPLEFVSEQTVHEVCDCKPGFLGPIGLEIPILVDRDAAVLADFVCGANQDNYHYINVNWERDVALPEVVDLRNVVAGDLSPDGKGKLKFIRGIEVGHIFQLGDKYSKPMNAKVLTENGKEVPVIMGCYGIGISRIVAAAIEQNHDEHGIIWPQVMAPFDIALIPINLQKSKALQQACEKLYKQLTHAGFDVFFDDRKERPGVMFADCELIGIPHRLVLSDRGLESGMIEYKARNKQNSEQIELAKIVDFLGMKLVK